VFSAVRGQWGRNSVKRWQHWAACNFQMAWHEVTRVDAEAGGDGDVGVHSDLNIKKHILCVQ
jgi:hypothetical protein